MDVEYALEDCKKVGHRFHVFYKENKQDKNDNKKVEHTNKKEKF